MNRLLHRPTEKNVPQPAPLELSIDWESAQAGKCTHSLPGGQPSPTLAQALHSNLLCRPLNSRDRIREALLLIFCDPVPRESRRLWLLTGRQWSQALYWLDVSGLALYFLDRVVECGLEDMVPPRVLARLRQNLSDNTDRTSEMIAESNAIQRSFQNAGISWVTLKGFSLWPVSVPRLELRSQLDLDFLVAEDHAPHARRLVEDRGYRLHAISGRSWEFKAGEMPRASLKDLYRATPHRSVELHIEPASAKCSLLEKTEQLCLRGVSIPVLAPEDLFLGQGLHLFKHLCSESSRASHMLEFRRHVMARSQDADFWNRLRSLAEADPRAPQALGVATQWITRVMGSFAPEAFTSWTVDRLPSPVRLWIEVYGRRIVFSGFPGTKLYLLLQQELTRAGALAGARSVRQALVPRKLPPPIAPATLDESLRTWIRRHWRQFRFVLSRLRFHVVEDLRYWYESYRWNRLRKRVGA